MNSAISTNDDLAQLYEELVRVQCLHTVKVVVSVTDFAVKRLLQNFFQSRKFRNFVINERGPDTIDLLKQSKDRFLVIYDLEMPDKNGLQLLAEVRKLPDSAKNHQILLLTGVVSAPIREKLIAAGANGILQRPLTQDALMEALKELRIPV